MKSGRRRAGPRARRGAAPAASAQGASVRRRHARSAPTPDAEAGDGADAALASALRRVEAGRPVTLAWLRAAHPAHWEKVHQSLALLSWLEAGTPSAASDTGSLAGARVAGWVLEDVIGAGATAVAYRARPADGAGPHVCVKLLRPELMADPASVRRFLREARLGLGVRHPAVVRALAADVCPVRGRRTAYLAMELVEGRTLLDLLRERGRLPDAECRALGRDLARGLAALHDAGVVHRDLKPANVLVGADGAVRIADLGVAWDDDVAATPARRGAFAGTLRYAAPEQFGAGAAAPDLRTDLYALGGLLFEAATGRAPRRAASRAGVVAEAVLVAAPRARDERPDVSPFLDAVISSLLASDPADRPATAHAAARILDEGEAGAWWTARRAVSSLPFPAELATARLTPICGRDALIGELRAMLVAAAGGAGAAAILEGEGGVGKTRLLAEFAADAVARGVRCAVALPLGAKAAGDPVLDALRRAVPEARRARTVDDAVRAATVRGPLALLVEDLHLASGAVRASFVAACRAAAGQRALVVGTMRPAGSDPWAVFVAAVEGVRVLRLPRLAHDDAMVLVAAALGPGALGASALEDVVAAGAGLPLALHLEAVRRTRGRPDETTATRVAASGGPDVPAAVLDAVASLLGRLTAGDRALVVAAACCGRAFSARDAAHAAGRPVAGAAKDLARLAAAGALLASRGAGFTFVHDIVLDAVHAVAPAAARSAAHRRLAARGAAGDSPDDALAARVRHLLAAGDAAAAAPDVVAAATHLNRTLRFGDGVETCRAALAFPQIARGETGVRLLSLLADAAVWLGDRATARDASDRAVAAAAASSGTASGDARLLAYCLDFSIRVRINAGEDADAAALTRRMLRVTDSCGDADLRARALLWMASLAQRRGDVRAARAWAARLAAFARRGGPPWCAPALHDIRASIARGQTRLREEVRERRAAADAAEALGRTALADALREHLGPPLLALGRTSEAMEIFRRTLDRARRDCVADTVAGTLTYVGRARAWCGDAVGAERALDAASAIWARVGATAAVGETETVRAAAEGRLGDPRAAYRRVRAALRAVRRRSQRAAQVGALIEAAPIALRCGRRESAARVARLATRLARSAHIGGADTAARVWARLAAGDAPGARRVLRRAPQGLFVFQRMTLAHAIWRETQSAGDLAVARRAVQAFLRGLDDEMRTCATSNAPEVCEVLAAIASRKAGRVR